MSKWWFRRGVRCCVACRTVDSGCGKADCGCHIGITLDCRDGLHNACRSCGCRCHREAA